MHSGFKLSTFGIFSVLLGSSSVSLADEVVRMPARCGIKSISVQHQREQNAHVTLATDRGHSGRFTIDGTTTELDNHTGTIPYKPHYPKLFAVSNRPYQIRVGGDWSGGSWAPWVKSIDRAGEAVQPFPDHTVVNLFTGQHEDHNTQVTFMFDRDCS